MNIQGLGSLAQVGPARALSSSAAGAPAQLQRAASSITNEQGQSLFDIRDELKNAIRDALENHDGSESLRSTIEGAIHSTLEDHGFDPAEVKSAMQDAGFDPRAGRPGASGSSGFQPAALLDSGGTEEDLIQSFLQQLRAGSQLDLEF